jgi:CheY-like chemotaxis protein
MTPKLVLVVDDDEDVRESICDVLAIAGHSSVGAADGRAALELLHTRRFDLIVTDLQMPGMDGWQLLSALEATGVLASIPVCVVSAEAQAPGRATRFLKKPFDLVALLEMVTEVFARPRCHRCAA